MEPPVESVKPSSILYQSTFWSRLHVCCWGRVIFDLVVFTQNERWGDWADYSDDPTTLTVLTVKEVLYLWIHHVFIGHCFEFSSVWVQCYGAAPGVQRKRNLVNKVATWPTHVLIHAFNVASLRTLLNLPTKVNNLWDWFLWAVHAALLYRFQPMMSHSQMSLLIIAVFFPYPNVCFSACFFFFARFLPPAQVNYSAVCI